MSYAEDGDLSKYTPEQVVFGLEKTDKTLYDALKTSNWIDADDFIHDWLDYAGRYLKSKYHTANPLKYKEILDKYLGRTKGLPKGKAKSQKPKPKVIQPTYLPELPNLPDLYTPEFLSFYEAYPKKIAKPSAFKAWRKIAPSNGVVESIMKGLAKWKQSPDWLKDNGQYIPLPAKWLNQRRWEDEIPKGGHNASDRLGFKITAPPGKYAGLGTTVEDD